MALGSMAILAVYFAGFLRTRSAAQRDDDSAVGRRFAAAPPAVATAPARATKVAVGPLPINPPLPSPAPVASPLVAAPPTAAPSVVPLPAPVAVVAPPTPDQAIAAAPVTTAPVATPPVPTTPISSTPVAAAPAVVPAPKWKDGTFTGWGHCRHGDLEATVIIKGGQIVSSYVSTCRTRYSADVIDSVVPQVVKRQSPDIDAVAGATQSSDAYYYAVSNALLRAKPESAKPL